MLQVFSYQLYFKQRNHYLTANLTFMLFLLCIQLIFYLLLPITRESIAFRSNFRSEDFDGFTRFQVPLNPKIIFLAFGQCVCVSVISITQKQIIPDTSNLIFYFCIMYRCYLKLFYKNQTKTLSTGEHKRILIHYVIWTAFLVNEFYYI